MKSYFKYSILTILALALTISLVIASPATIGSSSAYVPYESMAQAYVNYGVGVPTAPGRMFDGAVDLAADFLLGSNYILRPSSDAAIAWLIFPASPTTHYVKVNEATANGDTSYINTATNGATDVFGFPDIADTGAPEGALSVRVTFVAKDGVAGDDEVRAVLRIGGTVYPAATGYNPTAAYVASSYTWTTNPATAGAWDITAINALEAGVRQVMISTTTNNNRVTQVYLEVLTDTGYFELNTFANMPVGGPFPIAYVDIKVKYTVSTALTDDTYRIEYTTGSNPWIALQSATGDTYDAGGVASLGRDFTQLADPSGDGLWDWTDIGNIRIKITANQAGGVWDAKTMLVYEAWVQANPTPLPPASSPTLSLQPTVIAGLLPGSTFFVDVYAVHVNALWGWQIAIIYDTNILTATEWCTYAPFVSEAIPGGGAIDDTAGFVSASYFTFSGDTVGFPGVNTTIARIYFTVDAAGTTTLDLTNQPPTYITELKPVGASGFTPPLHDSNVISQKFMSAQPKALIDLFNPLTTQWHELYPQYSNTWILTSWIDNGDTMLSASDQIDMLNATGWRYWFHVDAVTITIHWTFKLPDEGTGEAEPEYPVTEMPLGSPIGTRWHQIYPTYSRMFTITSWTDQDSDGNFNPSDQFDWEYDDQPGVIHNAHLDDVSTDIILSQKGEPEPGGVVPEFPLGVGVLMSLVALIPVIYVWRTRPKKKVE